MSSPNEPRDPGAPDEQPGTGPGSPDSPSQPSGPDVPPYPAGTGPDTPAAPGYGQPPAYGQGQPPTYGEQPTYGQPAYGQAPGYGAPQSTARNSLGVWSLVLGILSIVLCCLVVGIVPGAIGVWLGFKGRSAAARGEASNGGMALAGIILGIVGILASLYMIISLSIGLAEYGGLDGFLQYVEDEVERQQLQAP